MSKIWVGMSNPCIDKDMELFYAIKTRPIQEVTSLAFFIEENFMSAPAESRF
jgi:hypothetical protein